MWKIIPVIILAVTVYCGTAEARSHYYYGKADWAGARRTLHITEKEAGATVVWNDTSTVTLAGAKISQWNDTVASYHLTQATDANRPTVGTLNGRRVAVFDNSDDYMDTAQAASTMLGTSAKSVIAVVKSNGIDGADHEILRTVEGAYFLLRQTSANAFAIVNYDTNSDSSGIAASAGTFVLSGTHDGTNIQIWKNGAASTPAASGATGSLAAVLRMGNSSATWNGSIAALAVFNVALAADKRASVEQFERRYWRF